MHRPTPYLADPTGEAANEAWRVLDLIAAEFASDPMSVQCFDLRVVERAKAVVAERRRLERSGEVPPLLTEGTPATGFDEPGTGYLPPEVDQAQRAHSRRSGARAAEIEAIRRRICFEAGNCHCTNPTFCQSTKRAYAAEAQAEFARTVGFDEPGTRWSERRRGREGRSIPHSYGGEGRNFVD